MILFSSILPFYIKLEINYNISKLIKKKNIHIKKASEYYNDVVTLFVFCSIVFVFSNMTNTFNIFTILGITVGTFVSYFLFLLPGFENGIRSIETIKPAPIISLSIFMLLLIVSFGFTTVHYVNCGAGLNMTIYITIPILFIISTMLVYFSNREIDMNVQFLVLPLALFFRIPNHKLSSFMSGLFIGIFIDGISQNDKQSIFKMK
jgi:hypothetical protein